MKVHTPTTFPYSHTPAASSKNRMLCHYEAQIGRMCGTEPRSRRSLQHFKGEAHCHIQVHWFPCPRTAVCQKKTDPRRLSHFAFSCVCSFAKTIKLIKQSTDSLVRELLSAKKKPTPDDWVILPFLVCALSPKQLKLIKHALLEQLQLAEHVHTRTPNQSRCHRLYCKTANRFKS